MLHKRKILIIFILTAFIVVSIAASKAPVLKERNLKILPKDISDAKLDIIMQTYNVALGVKCNFCHAPYDKMNFAMKDSLDYASDAEPMKEEARKMMRLTIDINKNYFYYNKDIRPEYLHVVHCKTCHQGEPFPPED